MATQEQQGLLSADTKKDKLPPDFSRPIEACDCTLVCRGKGLCPGQSQCFGCGKGRFDSWVLTLNAIAALLHLALFVGLIVIVSVREQEFPATPLDEKVAVWEDATANATDPVCKWSAQCVNPITANGQKPPKITTADGDQWYIYDKTTSYGELSLPGLIISFSALSFVFQALRPCVGWNDHDYLQQVENRTQFLRWIEYSVSASVMILSVALVVNVTSYSNIVMFFTSTFATQFCGLVAELLLEKQPKNQRGEKYESNNFLPAFLIVFAGWVLQIGVFISLFASFVLSVEKATEFGGESPPWWVWVIVVGMAVLFCSFGIVNLVDLVQRYTYDDEQRGGCGIFGTLCCMGRDTCCCCASRTSGGRCGAPGAVEIAYIVLSLVAKGLLSLLVATNLFLDPTNE